MPTLNADFVADWVAILRGKLAEAWGTTQLEKSEDKNIPIFFFDSFRRHPLAHKRELKAADDFHPPEDHIDGWTLLRKCIKDGEDLAPHLSKNHEYISNNDGLLNEWGVHHFHLGTTPCPKNPRFVNRTRSVLFAYLTDTTFYAINFFTHKENAWNNLRIVESLHRNWPEAIAKYKVVGISAPELQEQQRDTIRKKNGSAFVQVSDGTVYAPLASPVSSAGCSLEAVRQADIWRNEIRELQIGLEKKLLDLVPLLSAYGHLEESELKATLKISREGYSAYLPDLDLTLQITLQDEQDVLNG